MRPTGSDDVAGEVAGQQGEVADHVEDLVPGALVAIPQLVADRAVGAEDQQVGLGRPPADAGLAHRPGLGLEQEGPARRQLGPETLGRDLDEVALRPDRGRPAVVEAVGQDELVGVARVGRQDARPVADRHRPVDDERLAGPVLLDDPRAMEGLDERPARPVAAGGLGPVDLDPAVVDGEPGQGGHDVLDHLDGRRAALEGRPPLAGGDILDVRRDGGRPGQIAPDEDDAGVGLGRPEADLDVASFEEADAADGRLAGDRALGPSRREHGREGSIPRGGGDVPGVSGRGLDDDETPGDGPGPGSRRRDPSHAPDGRAARAGRRLSDGWHRHRHPRRRRGPEWRRRRPGWRRCPSARDRPTAGSSGSAIS